MIQWLRSVRYVRNLRNYNPNCEPDLLKLPGVVSKGDTVIDVGAAIGLYAYNLSKLVGPRGTVIAYEPWPKSYDILRRNMKGLGCENVVALPYAMSNYSGSGTMHIPGGLSHYFACLDKNSDGPPVPVRTFDDTLMEYTDVSFVKVDAEGNEASILKGAREFLDASHAVWMVEINGWWDISGIFKEHSYHPTVMNTENCFFVKD